MEIEPDAEEVLKAYVAQALESSGLPGPRDSDARNELYSHVFEAASRHAQREGAARIGPGHAQAAIQELGPAPDVGRNLTPTPNPLRLRLPHSPRSYIALGLAGTALFLILAYVVVGLLCSAAGSEPDPEFGTCSPVVTAWAGFLVAAVLAGAVGVWTAQRWVPFTSGTLLLILPLMSATSDWIFASWAAVFLIGAGLLVPGGGPRAAGRGPSAWFYLIFFPLGAVAVPLTNLVLSAFNLPGEGAQGFLPIFFLVLLALWGIVVALVPRKGWAFAAGSLALSLLGAFLGFMALFMLSFADSGCFERAPWRASWNDRELFETLHAPGGSRAWSVMLTPPPAGLPFQNETFSAAWGDANYSLMEVRWRPPDANRTDASWIDHITLRPGGLVTAMWWGPEPAGHIVQAMSQFLMRLGNATEDAVLAYGQQLFDRGTVTGTGFTNNEAYAITQSQISVNVSWALDTAWELDRKNGLATTNVDPAPGSHVPWRYQLGFAKKTASGQVDDRPVHLEVDAWGTANGRLEGAARPSAQEWRSTWNATYETLGLDSAHRASDAAWTGSRMCVD